VTDLHHPNYLKVTVHTVDLHHLEEVCRVWHWCELVHPFNYTYWWLWN